MSKLHAQFNLNDHELSIALGGGGGGGSRRSSGSGRNRWGRPTSTSGASNSSRPKQSSQCLTDAATAGVLAGGGFAKNPPLAATIGTSVAVGVVVTGKGDCIK